MNELRDDGMNESVQAAARLLRQEVPVRAVWRDALIERIEADRLIATRRVWTVRPWAAVAAGIFLVAIGVIAGRSMRTTDRLPSPVVAAQATPTVRFVFVAPRAGKVSVVGDFNQWNPKAMPLRRLGDGTWVADVPVAPGRYAYAFVVDGRIEVDPSAPRADDGDFGVNSILMVRGS